MDKIVSKKTILIFFVWILIFVVTPIILIFFNSFLNTQFEFSLENYRNFFSSSYLQMTLNSILIGGLVTILVVALGIPTAYIISKSKHHRLLILLIIIPMWTNLLLKIYSFIGLLGTNGILNNILNFNEPIQWLFTLKGYLIVNIYIFLPFMIIPIYNALIKIDENIIEASYDLGASELQTFLRVIFPQLIKPIKSGIQMVFLPSLSFFMITRLIAGNKIVTLGTVLEQHFLVTNNWSMGSVVAIILLLLVIIGSVSGYIFDYIKTRIRKRG